MTYRVVFWFVLLTTTPCFGLPDLIVWGETFNPKITTTMFRTTDCEVVEGCSIAGPRRVLAFDTEARNIGTTDLVLGSPINNPLFEYASCHQHYHFRDYADYQLLDALGRSVARGLKVGFCLEDVMPWDPGVPKTVVYNCNFQGIQVGWADVYVSSLPCQWIDITSLPGGVYNLRVEVDPNNRIPELNETNNTAAQFVVLDDPCTNAPTNDAFANAQSSEGRIATILGSNSCATRETGEPRHNRNDPAAKSVWYRWLPNYTGDATITTLGSTFDTILAVYRGSSLTTLASVASNDDVAPRLRWSSVTFRVTNGVPQFIAVDGYSGAAGGLALNINPAANDRFTNCLAISGLSGSASGINAGATTEAGEPAHGFYSVWYCWTAPTNGPFHFDTQGSSFDTRLTVYRGTALSNLTEVASNDDGAGVKTSALLINAVGGNTYFLAVTSPDATGPGEGLVWLTWEPAVSPRITSISHQSSDTYRLAISGQTNDQYMIQFSRNLRTWDDRIRVTNSVGVVTYTDTSSTTSGFYRLILLP